MNVKLLLGLVLLVVSVALITQVELIQTPFVTKCDTESSTTGDLINELNSRIKQLEEERAAEKNQNGGAGDDTDDDDKAIIEQLNARIKMLESEQKKATGSAKQAAAAAEDATKQHVADGVEPSAAITATAEASMTKLAESTTVPEDPRCPWPNITGADYAVFQKSKDDGYFGYESPVAVDYAKLQYLTRRMNETKLSPVKSGSQFKRSDLADGEYALFSGLGGGIVKPPFSEKLFAERKQIVDKQPSKRPSIFIVLLDSVSRAQYLREMPETRRTMAEQLTHPRFSFSRFHSFGGGSIHNKIPLHTGLRYRNFTKSGTDNVGPRGGLSDTYTQWSFQRARRQGYVTTHTNAGWVPWGCTKFRTGDEYHAGHYPSLTIDFYYPGRYVYDHYFPRSIICPHGRKLVGEVPCCGRKPGYGAGCTNHSHVCLGGEWTSKMVLNWALQLKARYAPVPMFGMVTVWEPHENIMLGERRMDRAFSKWLADSQKQGAFQDTVLVVMSDHGSLGPYLRSEEGGWELKMPLFEMFVPQWLLDSRQGLAEALRYNQDMLVTPADIYETLIDFMEGDGQKRGARVSSEGNSLFDKMDSGRTCADASIPLHACVCTEQFEGVDIPVNHTLVQLMATRSVTYANGHLKQAISQSVCSEIVLDSILSAQRKFLVWIWYVNHYSWVVRFSTTSGMILRAELTIKEEMKPTIAVTRITQETQFGEKQAPCRAQAENLGLNLHLCSCA